MRFTACTPFVLVACLHPASYELRTSLTSLSCYVCIIAAHNSCTQPLDLAGVPRDLISDTKPTRRFVPAAYPCAHSPRNGCADLQTLAAMSGFVRFPPPISTTGTNPCNRSLPRPHTYTPGGPSWGCFPGRRERVVMEAQNIGAVQVFPGAALQRHIDGEPRCPGPRPFFLPYSPAFRELLFSEARIQDRAWITPRRLPGTS